MAKSYAEVRAICHRPTDTVYTRVFYRRLSVPVTYLLQFTPVTADQVSYAGLACGIGAFVGFAWGNYWAFLVGALLWQLMLLADHIDGEVARVKGHSGRLQGAFIEYIVIHALGHPITFFGLGLGAYRMTGEALYLYLGFTATLAVLVSILIYLLRFHLFGERFVRRGFPGGVVPPLPDPSPPPAAPQPFSVVRLARQSLTFLAGIIETSLLLVAAALLNLVGWYAGWLPLSVAGFPLDAGMLLLVLYGGFFAVGTAASFVSYAATRRLDEEYDMYLPWVGMGFHKR